MIAMKKNKIYLITIQEEPERNPFASFRRRIHDNIGTIRQRDAAYLAYALIDAIIDGFFPVLENYGERLEVLEDEVVKNPSEETLGKIYRIRRAGRTKEREELITRRIRDIP
jgi:magnesium transporter